MDDLITIILLLVALVNIGCFIYVLIKLFSEEGVLLGILGLICSLYTFIWGWTKANELGIRNVMIVWSLCIVFGLIINLASVF